MQPVHPLQELPDPFLVRLRQEARFIWHKERMALASVDGFYVVSSLLFVAIAAVGLFRVQGPGGTEERLSEGLCLGMSILAVAVLAALSVAYDFGDLAYPSRAYPYITSGRLILVVLIPFLILYVRGLDRLLAPVAREKARLVCVLAIVGLITVSEFLLTWPVFGSSYNWFHLR